MSPREARISIDLAREADFSLGGLRIRPSSREVLAAGEKEVLEPRVMQVLVALSRRRGEVISREDLIEECWAGRVVGEDAISRCIARVRRLAEAHGSFSVETIARVGYRLTENPSSQSSSGATPAAVPPGPVKSSRLAPILLAAAIFIVAAYFGATQWRNTTAERERQARVVTEILSLVQRDRYGRAFALGLPLLAEERHKSDRVFAEAWRQIVLPTRLLVAEAGATVYFKPYHDVDGEWIEAGTTPLTGMVDAPRGTLRIKITKPGFRTGFFVISNPGPSVENDPPNTVMARQQLSAIPLPLVAEQTLPAEMVLVPRTNIPVVLSGWSTDVSGSHQQDIPAFAIARNEVTNQEFKQFIDAGGYDNPAYWQAMKFQEDDRELTWEQARKRFVDATGRPGPAGWQLSTYPSGQAEFPVGGISWYEAVAYARFRGATLPTVHHWLRAAFAPYDVRFNVAPVVATVSRFSADSPVSARSAVGLGPWGTYHMSGNVREWVWNFAGKNGLALGGAWSDYASENHGAYTTQPMNRAPTHGLRLMHTLPGFAPAAELLEPIRLAYDLSAQQREPVSDEAFAAMRFQFSTARIDPLEVTVRPIQQSPVWIAEEVTLRFPGEELATLYIVSPRAHRKPLQPIIYGPPQNCCNLKRPNRNTLEQLRVAEFVVNSGRALVMPIWWNSYERLWPPALDPDAITDLQRKEALAWQRDLSVALDYLQSRDDVDVEKAGYLGFSRGATYNAIELAIEPRLKAAVLLSGGISVAEPIHPMLDLVNYAPRIGIPVLMINGRFDHIFPYAPSQKRLFDLLGTPANKKSHIVYDGGHFTYPPNSVARDASNWFDRYLGSVR
jgi:DNA-binding winged helix-turn-helix (wHTH) protein/formylglycine-generating enzyme required for sulfatase activity/dienelactone hydrolase